VHDAEAAVWLAIDMLAPCPNCGHVLWAEVRSLGALRFSVYFDDEVQSESYAEHVKSCPKCDAGLGGELGESSSKKEEVRGGVLPAQVSPYKDNP